MNELVKIETNENLEPIISGRELHEKLGVNSHYKDWIKRMLDYGFAENVDYVMVAQKRASNEIKGFTEYNDHLLKLDTAKEICMLQRNEKGKMFRQYFIQVEKDYNSPEKIMARALMIADKKIKVLDLKIDQLEQKIEKDKSKVIFAEALEVSKTNISVGAMASILTQNGYKIGRNKFFEWLRGDGYLIKKGRDKNSPTEKSKKLEIMVIKEKIEILPNGENQIRRTTLITPKGQKYFINIFLNDKEVD